MKLCVRHEMKLVAALNARGLAQHIPEVPRLIGNAYDADPLTIARYTLFCNGLAIAGPHLTVDNPDGSRRCPMCFTYELVARPEHCNCSDPDCTPERRVAAIEAWIDAAADEQAMRYANVDGLARVH